MRITVTLDHDVVQLVRDRMRRDVTSFNAALNDAIRAAEQVDARQEFRTRTFSMGRPALNLDQALPLAGDLEDDELVHRSERRG